MIYVTGDTHADFRRFTTENFPEQREMSKDDFVIILGDFGGIWAQEETKEEAYWLDWLNEKPFTLIYVGGNHENYDRYYSDEFETVDFHGGKAQKIRESIYHLKRGEVFDFEGKKFFAFGGAQSHDIRDGIIDPADYDSWDSMGKACRYFYEMGRQFRIKGYSWWEKELPTPEEMEHGRKALAENDYKVDYVITHCAPTDIEQIMSHGGYKPDILTHYFQEIALSTKFKSWLFGHYHINRNMFGSQYVALYEQITRML